MAVFCFQCSTSLAFASQRLMAELDDVSLRVDNVRDQAIILMNGRGVSCQELVEPKLAELNRNFEKVSQHIKSAKVSQEEARVVCFANLWYGEAPRTGPHLLTTVCFAVEQLSHQGQQCTLPLL